MRTRSLRYLATLLALTVGMTVLAQTAQAEAPSLEGTRVNPDDAIFELAFGPADPTGCDPDGTSVINFSGTGAVSAGPFAGSSMSYSGQVTLGAQQFTTDPLTGPSPSDPIYGFPADYGVVTSVTGTFSVASADVVGTFEGLVPVSPVSIGSCYGVGAGDNFGFTGLDSGALIAVSAFVSYRATIGDVPVTGGIEFRQRQTNTLRNDPVFGPQPGYSYGSPFMIFYTPPTPPPAMSVQDVTVTEDAAAGAPVAVQVTLSSPALADTQVTVTATDGTATYGTDYELVGGATQTVTVPTGATSFEVAFSVVADNQPESDETFSVVLSNPQNATIGDGTGSVTIVNDDAFGPQSPDDCKRGGWVRYGNFRNQGDCVSSLRSQRR